MRVLLFISALFISFDSYDAESADDLGRHEIPDSRLPLKKRKFHHFREIYSSQALFDEGLKYYSKYIQMPEKKISLVQKSIQKFSLAMRDPYISTRNLHRCLQYTDYLSRDAADISHIQRLILKENATIDDYSLALNILSTSPHLDLYDVVLEKILSIPAAAKSLLEMGHIKKAVLAFQKIKVEEIDPK